MSHGDDGAGIFLEKSFEPCNQFRVQVIRGFVEQQHVRFGEQQAAQGDPALLAAGQIADIGIPGR